MEDDLTLQQLEHSTKLQAQYQRLECLKLAAADGTLDEDDVINLAKKYYAFVEGE